MEQGKLSIREFFGLDKEDKNKKNVTRTETIVNAIENNNITPHIQEMMEQDIKQAKLKRIKEMFKSK